MIGKVLEKIKNILDRDIKSRLSPASSDPIITLGNASQLDNLSNLSGKILMSLVNIEQDTPLRNNAAYTTLSDTQIRYHNPKLYLNLYVLFVLHQTDETDITGLDMLTHLIASLQFKHVFTQADLIAVDLPPSDIDLSPENSIIQTEQVIFDMYSLSFEQLNNLWGVLGGKYMPSVLYKVRLVTVYAHDATDPANTIQTTESEEGVINER